MNKKRYNNGVEFRSQSTLSPGSKDLSIFSPASLRLNRAKSPLLAVLLLVCGASLHAVLTDSALADSGDIIFDGRINKSGDIPGGRANRDPTEREISRRVVTESADQYAAESIFNDEKPRPIKTATQPYVERRIRSSIAGSERRMERKMAIAEADTNLYDQMRQVANWLSQYCIWNRHWPDPGDQENDAIRQLNDLCPNNPY